MSTTQQIDPGEGYRLLEPPSGDYHGEPVLEGDECWDEGRWKESWNYQPDGSGGRQSIICQPYRRRISPASPWTPVAQTPLPESGYAWLAYRDGKQSEQPVRLGMFCCRSLVAAYILLDKPEPYVPPEPEKRERTVAHAVIDDGENVKSLHRMEQLAKCAADHGDRIRMLLAHYPGDVPPDAANRARDTVKQKLVALRSGHQGDGIARACMEQVLRILEPEGSEACSPN